MDLTEGSETSANINQTLGKHPKVNTVNNGMNFLPLTEPNPTDNLGWAKVPQPIDVEKCD
jgi:hypothetical protein